MMNYYIEDGGGPDCPNCDGEGCAMCDWTGDLIILQPQGDFEDGEDNF